MTDRKLANSTDRSPDRCCLVPKIDEANGCSRRMFQLENFIYSVLNSCGVNCLGRATDCNGREIANLRVIDLKPVSSDDQSDAILITD